MKLEKHSIKLTPGAAYALLAAYGRFSDVFKHKISTKVVSSEGIYYGSDRYTVKDRFVDLPGRGMTRCVWLIKQTDVFNSGTSTQQELTIPLVDIGDMLMNLPIAIDKEMGMHGPVGEVF